MSGETTQGLENTLIEHLAHTRYADLNKGTVDYCKLLIMDALGVTFPGSLAPGCPELIDTVGAWPCPGGASLLISGRKVAPPLAAMANSAMMHALDFDDTLDASALHTCVTVLPAAFAVAESGGSPIHGKDLITALVLGMDVICRVSLGIQRPLSWIRTATCGSFGAAAVAGKLLGLDPEALTNALGAVYSQTSGNVQGLLEGRLIKRMQPGFAAAAGVTSAFLARRGVTASHRFLTGDYGFYNLYEQGEFDPAPVLSDLGRRFTVDDLSIKPYPSCRMTHSAIDAALALRDALGEEAEKIESIDVGVSSMVAEMVGKPLVIGTNPQVDAQFSIPYTVSCAMIKGDVFLGDFEPDAIQLKSVLALADRVSVKATSSLPANDLLSATLTVRIQGGDTLKKTVTTPLGNPTKPMSPHQCREKFAKCVAHSRLAIDARRIETLLSAIENLDTLPDVRQLIELMKTEADPLGEDQ